MATHQRVFWARYYGDARGQYVPDGGARSNVDEVVDLLAGAADGSGHQAVGRAANRIIGLMAEAPWRVTAGRHRGGIGGNARAADANLHITVQVRGRGYHLQLNASGHLWRITGDDGMELVVPWASPGAPSTK
jgi:hypothetical protein